jgi:EAL domain-containing protein (putative c-di-GMP-specific phosphodiesterase class I)
VQDLEQDPNDEAIVAAVIGLGKSLHLRITGEGVETTGQAQRLREMGCGYAQGYYFSQPVTGSEVPDLLHGARYSGSACRSLTAGSEQCP